MWSVDSRDYDRFNSRPDEIVNNVLSQTRNGSIILLHDRNIRTIRALEPMIEQLKARGFAFETVSQLIEQQ
jgi:peptidoglycan/xylan/chitin deacetylase (PgdA/CDA1 family)